MKLFSVKELSRELAMIFTAHPFSRKSLPRTSTRRAGSRSKLTRSFASMQRPVPEWEPVQRPEPAAWHP